MAKTKLKKAPQKKVKGSGKKLSKKAVLKQNGPRRKPETKAVPQKVTHEKKLKLSTKKPPKKSASPLRTEDSKKEKNLKAGPKASPTKASRAETQLKATPPQKRPPLGPIEPGRLGQKRPCLKCGIKFYDFERLPITCPKCFSEFDPEDFEPKISLKSDSKKSRPVEKEEESETEIVVSDSGEDFESLEDLSDDDSAVVGIETGKDSDESFD